MPRPPYFHLLSSAVPVGEQVPDGELLRRFAHERDAAAFELLVRRHADAVWTACRGVLRCEADAEDAFQATFVVLARRAGTVRGASAGAWLYRVAVNAAIKLRERSARVAIAPAEQLDALPAPAPAESDPDLAALVRAELANLPGRYRLAVVLCELEGHTHAEAAKVLGWPVGSVSSRLSRAWVLLRDRLARRGVSVPVAVLPALGLPLALVRDTTAVAAGAAPVLPTVSALAEGVLSMMRAAHRKLMALGLASVGLVALAGWGTYTALAQPAAPSATGPGAAQTPTNPKPQPTGSRPGNAVAADATRDTKGAEDPRPTPLQIPKELRERQRDAARQVYEQNLKRIQVGQGLPSELFGWSEHWLDADLALVEKAADRAEALRAHLDRTREVESLVVRLAKAGEGRQADADAATYFRLEAEVRLFKEGVEPHRAKEEKGRPEKK